MLIYPAIDLREGKCVRLTKGDFASSTVYNDNPKGMLETLATHGAKWVHIVDLDGAKQGSVAQTELLQDLLSKHNHVKMPFGNDFVLPDLIRDPCCETPMHLNIQVGGGVRSKTDIETILNYGANRVVLGSICVSNRESVKLWLDEFGNEKLVLALDCAINAHGIPCVKTRGWQDDSAISVWELLEYYTNAKYLLCTDISVDGTLAGPNIDLYKQIKKRFPDLNIIASGGVGSYDDLDKLREIDVYAVVVGKAMYEGKIDIAKVLSC